MPKHQKGVRDWKGKKQAYVRVNGKLRAKSFPLNTDPAKIQAWRAQQQTLGRRDPLVDGSFAADVDTYLSRVTAMRSFDQHARILRLWVYELGGDRTRDSITPTEIDQVLQRWLTSKPDQRGYGKGRPVKGSGLNPATVRKRRSALLSFFYRLDGRHASNPVRASQAPREPKLEARGLDYPTIARIFAEMPDSGAKRRCAVVAFTGLPPAILKLVQVTDVHWKAATVRVQPRRKGAGVEARTLPLLPQGLEAFRALEQAGEFGDFNTGAVNACFRRAARKAGVPGISLYDLRHSFGALLYQTTHDLATVGRFLLHSSLNTTERYARTAMQAVDARAAAAAGESLQKLT